MKNYSLNLPRYVHSQGNVNLVIPGERIVHRDITDAKRVRLGLTDNVTVACHNGGFHICYTDRPELVTCPACLAA